MKNKPNSIENIFVRDKDILPGANMIGKGYDIFGLYADLRYIQFPIFNWRGVRWNQAFSDKEKYILSFCKDTDDDTYIDDFIVTDSVEKLSKEVSKKIDLPASIANFSRHIEAALENKSSKNYKTAYSRISKGRAAWSIWINDISEIYDHIDMEIRWKFEDSRIKKDEIINFYNTFGLYFISGLTYGSKFLIDSIITEANDQSDFKLEMIAQAGFKSIAKNIKLEAKSKERKAADFYEKNASSHIDIVGGSSELARLIRSDKESAYADWIASTRKFPKFIDFHPKNGLTPYFELIKNKKVKTKFKEVHDEIIAKRADEINTKITHLRKEIEASTQPPPKEITCINRIQTYNQKVPSRFVKTDAQNLNHNVSGSKVQVRVAVLKIKVQEGKKAKGITDLKVCRNLDSIPKGYNCCRIQLNDGNNGYKLYLAYKWGKAKVEDLIKSIGSSNSSNRKTAQKKPTYYDKRYKSFKRVGYKGSGFDGDTNADAGNNSDFVYLWYSKKLR